MTVPSSTRHARDLGPQGSAILACLEACWPSPGAKSISDRACLPAATWMCPSLRDASGPRKLTSRLVPIPVAASLRRMPRQTPCLTQEGRSQTSRPAPCHEGGDCQAISGGFEDTDEREMELWRALHQIYSAADAAKRLAPAASEAGISVVVAGVTVVAAVAVAAAAQQVAKTRLTACARFDRPQRWW